MAITRFQIKISFVLPCARYILKTNTYVYDYQKDEKDLKTFIANNIAKATELSKIKIDKNNFIPIYLRWLEIIKPNIDVNWDTIKKQTF